MPCYHPITALQPTAGGPLLFPKPEHLYLYNDYRTLQVPCGQCYGCKLTRSRHWAIRCMHEKQMHKHSCYLTLTYRGNAGHSLNYPDFQKFLKRLRRRADRGAISLLYTHYTAQQMRLRYEQPQTRPARAQACALSTQAPTKYRDLKIYTDIRFYAGGEYGELHGRPHWHALLFGVDFNDKKLHKQTIKGFNLYTSATLNELWPYGFSTIGDLTFESAAYVARYVMKKKTGDGDRTNYQIIDLETGEINIRRKEFNTMSRRNGIGSSWLTKYQDDVYANKGKVILRGHEHNPPRYYDKLYAKIDQLAIEGYKHARYIESLAQREHQTPERLAVQEQVAIARTATLKRNLTSGD